MQFVHALEEVLLCRARSVGELVGLYVIARLRSFALRDEKCIDEVTAVIMKRDVVEEVRTGGGADARWTWPRARWAPRAGGTVGFGGGLVRGRWRAGY